MAMNGHGRSSPVGSSFAAAIVASWGKAGGDSDYGGSKLRFEHNRFMASENIVADQACQGNPGRRTKRVRRRGRANLAEILPGSPLRLLTLCKERYPPRSQRSR